MASKLWQTTATGGTERICQCLPRPSESNPATAYYEPTSPVSPFNCSWKQYDASGTYLSTLSYYCPRRDPVPFGGCPAIPYDLEAHFFAAGQSINGLVIPLVRSAPVWIGQAPFCGGFAIATFYDNGGVPTISWSTPGVALDQMPRVFTDCSGSPNYFSMLELRTVDYCTGNPVIVYNLGIGIRIGTPPP